LAQMNTCPSIFTIFIIVEQIRQISTLWFINSSSFLNNQYVYLISSLMISAKGLLAISYSTCSITDSWNMFILADSPSSLSSLASVLVVDIFLSRFYNSFSSTVLSAWSAWYFWNTK
jgi:hypothetical protein